MTDTDKPINPKHEKLLKTRGRGRGKDYEPFIKVHEISSSGESVRIRSASVGRVHHLLSRIELLAFLVFDQFEQTIDIREQYPLPINDTLDICSRLGIRHPQIHGGLTVVSTDLLVDLSPRGSTPFPRTVLKRRTVFCPEQQLYVASWDYGTAQCNRRHQLVLHFGFGSAGGEFAHA